jgi:hypothetical protein
MFFPFGPSLNDGPLPSEKQTALLMLTTPPHITSLDLIDLYPITDIPRLRDALQEVCVDEQLLDVKDTWIFDNHNGHTFEFVLDRMRDRYQDLMDAPKIEESYYWVPDESYCARACSFNRDFCTKITEKLEWEIDRADFYRLIVKETDICYEQWCCLRALASSSYYVHEKRYYLGKYKKLITKEEWENKIMPPDVPIWRFYEVPFFKSSIPLKK